MSESNERDEKNATAKKTATKKVAKKKAVTKKATATKGTTKKAATKKKAAAKKVVAETNVIKRGERTKGAEAAAPAAAAPAPSPLAGIKSNATMKAEATRAKEAKEAKAKEAKEKAAAPKAKAASKGESKAPDSKAPASKAPASKAPASKPKATPAADLAAAAAAKREADPDAAPEPAAEAAVPEDRRKVRRSRSIAKPDGAPSEGRRNRRPRGPRPGDDERPAKPGEGGRTAPRSNAPRGKRRGGGGGTAMERLLATPRRTIYRQDLGGDGPPPPEPSKAELKAVAVAKAKESDKITLILHPAPKASIQRKKHTDRPKTAKEALRAKMKRNNKGKQKSAAAPAAKPAPVKLQAAWTKAKDDKAIAAAVAAGGAGEALVKAWVGAQNVAAIVLVAHNDGVPGKTRKAARRAINVLKSRGIEVPDAPETEVVAAPKEETIATFVPPDGAGVSFFSISKHQPGSRFHVADAVIRPPLGIVQASAGKLAGKQIRAWRTRVQKHFGASPVEVPLDWARHRIAEARRLNETSKQLLPLSYDRCVELFEPLPASEPDHPVADLEAKVDDKTVKSAKEDSDKLHNEPEFRSWMPDTQSMQELLAKVGERVGPDGVGDPKQVDAALKEEITSATDRFFSPERRELVSQHMRDSAISVRVRAGDETASRVLAVSRAVKEAGLITSPPSEIPFLVAYFQKAVAVMLQQQNGMLRVPVPQGGAAPG